MSGEPTGGATRSSRVSGRLDDMTAVAARGAQRAQDIERNGVWVCGAVDRFNRSVDADYQVFEDGQSLLALSVGLRDLDTFVGEIAQRLRNADAGVISFEMALSAIAPRFRTAVDLDRTASDLALSILDTRFSSFDSAQRDKADGVVSIDDLRTIARDHPVASTRAAAAWLLAHRLVLTQLDKAAAAAPRTHPELYAAGDGRLTQADIARYRERQAAYRVMVDNFELFDAAVSGKVDGKVSKADLKRLTYPPYDPALGAAAQVLLDDPRALSGYTQWGDQVAGVYDLDQVAKIYSEARMPLPAKPRSGFAGAACGVAGFYSMVGWLDLVVALAEQDGKGAAVAAATTVGTREAGEQLHATQVVLKEQAAAAVGKAGVATARRAAAVGVAAKVVAPGQPFVVAATAVDLLCRATDPKRRNWGTISPLPVPGTPPPVGTTTTVPTPAPASASASLTASATASSTANSAVAPATTPMTTPATAPATPSRTTVLPVPAKRTDATVVSSQT